GNKIDHFETIRVAKDGSERQISLTVSPIRNRRGKIIGASKIARDISMKIEAENKQKLYTQRLMDLNNFKDEFMVMASHELKTPLTVIMASLQILEQMMVEDSRVEFINRTINQVNKLNELIYKLFDVSKIHAGKLKFEYSVFDLKNLTEEIIEQNRKSTAHSLVFKYYGENFNVNADKERISQVIINIISNAIKYSPLQGEILIELRSENRNIAVNIYDKGIGIPQSDLENIFQRFYRVSGSASSFAGSGIGLYLSAEIIKHHKGEIWAESTIGEGPVFHFTIPALI
ncbi:MAG TPA: ATP-binding protein, partial [Hanamia sp.]